MAIYRYTFIFSTEHAGIDRDHIVSAIEKKVIKINPYLEHKIIPILPNVYVLLQTDIDFKMIKKIVNDSLVELELNLMSAGWGWSIPVSETVGQAEVNKYLDPIYSGNTSQKEETGIFSYNKLWISLYYGVAFAAVIFVVLLAFNNTALRILFIGGYLLYLIKNVPNCLIQIRCNNEGIIFKHWAGSSKQFEWGDIRCLKIMDIPVSKAIIYSSKTEQDFVFMYGLTKKETLIKTIIQNSKLGLAETTASNNLVYKRFDQYI